MITLVTYQGLFHVHNYDIGLSRSGDVPMNIVK